MIHGMTGYGRGEATAEGLDVVVDVRTVNHRYLDVDLRGASLPPELEARMRKSVSSRLRRGRAEVHVGLQASDPALAPVRLNRGIMLALVEGLHEVGRDMGLAEELHLGHVAQLPWARAMEPVTPTLSEAQCDAVASALDGALGETVRVREQEGRELARDLGARIARVDELLSDVREGTRDAAALHAERLKARLSELSETVGLDEARLAQEAALLADRGDVAEEVARLAAYLERLRGLLQETEAAGKRLDFTLQEAFREVNTIGSKARDLEVSDAVIAMKSELERMREQAANVE